MIATSTLRLYRRNIDIDSMKIQFHFTRLENSFRNYLWKKIFFTNLNDKLKKNSNSRCEREREKRATGKKKLRIQCHPTVPLISIVPMTLYKRPTPTRDPFTVVSSIPAGDFIPNSRQSQVSPVVSLDFCETAATQSDTVVWRKAVARNRTPCVSA